MLRDNPDEVLFYQLGSKVCSNLRGGFFFFLGRLKVLSVKWNFLMNMTLRILLRVH